MNIPPPAPIIQTQISPTAKLLLMFCSQNGRAILTGAERERLLHVCSEIERIEGHILQFAVGLAKRKLDVARMAYVDNPSQVNRVALDKVRAAWMAEDLENMAQRRIVSAVLASMVVKELKPLLPPMLRRAANALAWLAVQVRFEEEARHTLFETPYRASGIVEAIVNRISLLRIAADRIDSASWMWNGHPAGMNGCEWLTNLAKIEGEVWNLESLDPDVKRDSAKWRNFGQAGNPLFQPLLCERDGTAATAAKGIAVKKYPASATPTAAV
jgi:hypothetical protein